MVHRFRGGTVPAAVPSSASVLADVCRRAPGPVDAAMADSGLRRAARAVRDIVEETDRCIEATRPWEPARTERRGDSEAARRPDTVLATLVPACRVPADELRPFSPRRGHAVHRTADTGRGALPAAQPLFPRLREDTQPA